MEEHTRSTHRVHQPTRLVLGRQARRDRPEGLPQVAQRRTWCQTPQSGSGREGAGDAACAVGSGVGPVEREVQGYEVAAHCECIFIMQNILRVY
jgi:hypothetical protein